MSVTDIDKNDTRTIKSKAAILHLTDSAKSRVKYLMEHGQDSNDKNIIALRISLSQKGCSGMSYVVEYAYEKHPYEEIIQDGDISVFIDPSAIMFLIGSTMDYRQEQFSSGFVFQNPNEKARCGCGSSFMV